MAPKEKKSGLPTLTDDEKRMLISEIRNHALLWDANHEDYKDKGKKATAWTVISAAVSKPDRALCGMLLFRTENSNSDSDAAVIDAWKNLLRQFNKEKQKPTLWLC
jgi:hypothetical protein